MCNSTFPGTPLRSSASQILALIVSPSAVVVIILLAGVGVAVHGFRTNWRDFHFSSKYHL